MDRICSADKLQVASFGNLSDGQQIGCSLFSSTLLLSFEPQMALDVPKRDYNICRDHFGGKNGVVNELEECSQSEGVKRSSLFGTSGAISASKDRSSVEPNSEQLICRPSDKLQQLATCNLSAQQILSVK